MTLDHLIAVLATGGNHLGDLIWWSLSEAQIERTTLQSVWEPTGLPMDLLPEPPTAEKSLKVAVRECAVGQHDHLVRVAHEDDASVVWGIVREERHESGTLTYAQEAKVTLDRLAGVVSIDKPTHLVARSIKERFGQLRDTHTADDVRRTLTRTLLSFSAVLLRENGGIYWCPNKFAKPVRKLQEAIEKIGSSRVYLVPVHDSADANRTLGDVASKSLQDELDALKKEVEGFLTAPPERPSTLVRRFDAFEALRTRAQLYRDILQVQVADLDAQLDQLSGSVERLLAQKAAA